MHSEAVRSAGGHRSRPRYRLALTGRDREFPRAGSFCIRNSTRYTVELSMLSESLRHPGKGRPPLLVSSNPDVVDLYILALRSARIGALSVGAVDEAAQLIRDRSVSAVIVDVANPAVDWDL